MIGGRKTRSNKGVKRGPRKSRTNNSGLTRSGVRFRAKPTVKRPRKTRSNKGVKRGPRKSRNNSPKRSVKSNKRQSLKSDELARLGFGTNQSSVKSNKRPSRNNRGLTRSGLRFRGSPKRSVNSNKRQSLTPDELARLGFSPNGKTYLTEKELARYD